MDFYTLNSDDCQSPGGLELWVIVIEYTCKNAKGKLCVLKLIIDTICTSVEQAWKASLVGLF